MEIPQAIPLAVPQGHGHLPVHGNRAAAKLEADAAKATFERLGAAADVERAAALA